MNHVPHKTIGRLSLYRRSLNTLLEQGVTSVCSRELAQMTGATAVQVRRDLMAIDYSGSPMRGYDVARLLSSIADLLDEPSGQRAALVGIGNLGRAIITYFAGRRPRLAIVAAFDIDPAKVGRKVNGCPTFPMQELGRVARRECIDVGILAVPAHAAQEVAEQLVEAGICGILNFAPAALIVPEDVFVEDIDMTVSLEKAAYFARMLRKKPGPRRRN